MYYTFVYFRDFISVIPYSIISEHDAVHSYILYMLHHLTQPMAACNSIDYVQCLVIYSATYKFILYQK
jgi:hypothetical protein